MSTVSFSVPDDVKEAFNVTFAGQNKSAVVADWFARPCSAPTQTSRTLGFSRGCLNPVCVICKNVPVFIYTVQG